MSKNEKISIYIDISSSKLCLLCKDGVFYEGFSEIAFSDGFYSEFSHILRKFFYGKPVSGVSVYLPAECVFFDMITLPTLGKSGFANTLKNTLRGLYKNYDLLDLRSVTLNRNNSFTDIGISGVNKNIIASLTKEINNSKLSCFGVYDCFSVYESCISKNYGKFKGKSYAFLDVGEFGAYLIFVVNGYVAGFCDLSIGSDITENNVHCISGIDGKSTSMEISENFRQNEEANKESVNSNFSLPAKAILCVNGNERLRGIFPFEKIFVNAPENTFVLFEEFNGMEDKIIFEKAFRDYIGGFPLYCIDEYKMRSK